MQDPLCDFSCFITTIFFVEMYTELDFAKGLTKVINTCRQAITHEVRNYGEQLQDD